MRNQDFQRGEILEHVRVQQRHHGDAFFVDEMKRIRKAVGTATGGVDVAWNIQLDQLFVERIPVALAERRSLNAAGLAGIGIDQASHEPEFLDASLELLDAVARADAGALRQSADAAEDVRIKLGLLRDNVVGLFHEPVHELGMLAVHHLIRAGRDELHVGSRFLKLSEMRRAAEDRFIQGVLDVFVGGAGAAASVRAAMGYKSGFIYVELVGCGYMSVGVDDHTAGIISNVQRIYRPHILTMPCWIKPKI